MTGLRWWHIVPKRRARRAATRATEYWAEQENSRIRAEAAVRFRRAKEVWPGLEKNDPDAVIGALDDVFEDNHMPALPLDCEGSTVTIAMISGGKNELFPQTVVRDDRGRPRFEPHPEASERHRDSVLSNALATAKEAFATAPFIGTVQVIALERREGLIRRPQILPLIAVAIDRAELDRWDWEVPALDLLADHDPAFFALDEELGLEPLDLEDEPAIRAVVEEVAETLECRA